MIIIAIFEKDIIYFSKTAIIVLRSYGNEVFCICTIYFLN